MNSYTLRNAAFVFHGNANEGPMEWAVDWCMENGTWSVVETYDGGETWIANCELPTAEACIQFIWAWFIGREMILRSDYEGPAWGIPMTHIERLATICELERQQMVLPRGEAVWPNVPIQALAAAADAIIAQVPRRGAEYEELVGAFTWGLDEMTD